MRPSALLPGILATCALLAAAGCGGDLQTDARATALFHSADRHTMEAGTRAASGAEGVIGIILGARIVGGGDAVAVLDAAPPHVKVYGRDGRLRAAFLERGGGPKETRFPSALAPSGDSALIVTDVSGRIATFSLDGALLSETRVANVPVLAVAEVCGDGWVIYGPRADRSGRVAWLHRARRAGKDSVAVEHVYADSIRSRMLPVGVTYGLASGDGELVARHGFGRHSRLVRWACGATDARAERIDGVATLPDRGPDERGGGLSVFRMRGDDPTVAGMALTRAGVVLADIRYGAEGRAVTRLRLIDRSGERDVALRGAFHLRDGSARGGVLVSTSDPAPHVFRVSEDDLLGLFGAARR